MRVGLLLVLLTIPALSGEQPNILLIVSEDNGPELGCYGDPYAKTPVLDGLAAEGARFAKAFTPYSVCSPSRACFLTGLDPAINGQLGLATHKYAMYREWPNAFSLLKTGGYRTGLIGKLHVNPESAFTPHIDFRAIPSANFGRKKMAAYAAKAGEFFKSAEAAPFFLSINYPDAHFPLIPQAGGYPGDGDLLEGGDVKPLPWVGCDSPRLREATANYYNCMSRLDSLVGDLLGELGKAGKADNTLIVYIGDHGAQFSRGKTSVYDAGLRIPMIVHWPAQVNPAVRDELVSVTDLLPTMCEAAKIEPPAKLSGRSLWPLLEGKDVEWRRDLLAVTTGAAPALGCLQFALRTGRYKLIVTPPGQGANRSATAYLNHYNAHFLAGCTEEEIAAAPAPVRDAYATYLHPPACELYDLEADPHEFVNLAEVQDHQELLISMKRKLHARQRLSGDPLGQADHREFWLREAENGRNSDYRGRKGFRWGYLERFAPSGG
ncbi:MAG: sulfatase [Akkermansiaceae bacterium]|nr:sulfatase [Akkermansiaceae bacterium]